MMRGFSVRILRETYVFFVCCAVGCSASTENTSTTPEPAQLPMEALVWTQSDGGARTFWVVEHATGHTVAANRAGTVLAIDGELWSWQEPTAQMPLFDCQELGETEQTDDLAPIAFAEVESGLLRRLGSGEEIQVIRGERPESAEEHQQSITLRGTIGAHLFIVESAGGYYCGAHPTFGNTFSIWDAHQGRRLAPITAQLTSGDMAQLGSGPQAEALTALAARLEQMEMSPTDEQVELAALLPRFAPGQGMVLDYLYTVPTCYACGSHDWDAYAADVTVESPYVPEAWRHTAQAPACVASFAAAEQVVIGGWTVISGSETERAELRRLFAADQSATAPKGPTGFGKTAK